MLQRVTLLIACALVSLAVACAQPGAPPGGPPDTELPVLLKVLPESNAVNVRTPAIVLQFDEVISERSTGAGAQAAANTNSLSTVLLLTPSDGRDEVIWRRNILELRPRRGFRPNTTYRVTVAAGLTDLRNNRTTEAFDFVFSTGPSAASGEVRGVLFDWTTGKPALNARVELYLEGDSTFRWTARVDSAGRFRVRDLNAGNYQVRAWLDANNDRRISFREVSDSARVTLADTASLELYAFLRDTIAPRIENVEPLDSTGIRVRFDRGIVLDWDGAGISLLTADSSVIPLQSPLLPQARYDSLAKGRRAALDSAAKAAADSTPGDSTLGDSSSRRPSARPMAGGVAADSALIDSLAADTTAADSLANDTLPPAPVFRRTAPERSWSAMLNAPLAPGSYRIRIRGAPGLNGREVDSEREFRVRPPAPPADTTKATPPTTPPTTPPASAPAARPAAATPPSGGTRRP
jgi:hypothetical protein